MSIAKIKENLKHAGLPKLSKSQYLKGLQCPKALWFYRHRKDLKPEIDPATQARFDAGHEIGILAQQYFDDGIEVVEKYWEIEKAAQSTQQYIKDGHDVIFEATAINPTDGSYSRIDILRKIPDTDEWDLIEAKFSTGVKDYHLDDMSLQYHAFHGAGYKIRRCYMMVIDNTYVRDGDIDPQGLFRLEDISGEIFALQGTVEYMAAQLGYVLDRKKEPEATIGVRCFQPFECDYCHHCWAHVPDYSIYNIYRKKKAGEIATAIGSHEIDAIPPNLIPNGLKAVDVGCVQNNVTEHLDKAPLREFLGDFQYPLYFLDYETMMAGIPLFDGTRPYQQVPFQFSLHLQEAPDAELQHFEFLHKEPTDPRSQFAEALVAACGDEGSVVVYNQNFEMTRNRELAEDFPRHAAALEGINERVVDLMKPFQKRWIYRPEQQSSYSIKYVLPAFVPELSYDEMAIGNGTDAMEQYFQFATGALPEDDHEALWEGLLAYCKLDTYAMVALLDALKTRV